MVSEDFSVDRTGAYRAEFERLGEAGVEDLIVRDGRNQAKRAYALRWLEGRRHARLLSGAVALQRSRRTQSRARMMRLAVGAAFLASFSLTGLLIYLHNSGMAR